MDYCSLPQDMGFTQVSELKDEEVPEDSHGLIPGPHQVSELKDEEVPDDPNGLLQPPSQIWASPR